MIAFDCELTTTDLWHGALPYSMQICDSETKQSTIYEWSVNPLIRTPLIDPYELEQVAQQLEDTDELVAHHTKIDLRAFDTACKTIRKDLEETYEWDWEHIHDSLIMAHCWKNLWSHGLKHLREVLFFVDGYHQKRLLDATNKARRICRTKRFFEFVCDSINSGEDYGSSVYQSLLQKEYERRRNWSNVSRSDPDLFSFYRNLSGSKTDLLQQAMDNKERINSPWRIAGPQDPHWPGIKRSPSVPKKGLIEDNEPEGWAFYDMWLPKCIAEFAPQFLPEEERDESTSNNKKNTTRNNRSFKKVISTGSKSNSFATNNLSLQTTTNTKLQHRWFTLSAIYGIEDVETTLPLFTFLKQQLQDENLWSIYLDRQKLIQITYEMENHGVSLLPEKLDSEIQRYGDIANESREQARKIATTVIRREGNGTIVSTTERSETTNNKGTTGQIRNNGSRSKSTRQGRSKEAISRTEERRSNSTNQRVPSGSNRNAVGSAQTNKPTNGNFTTSSIETFNLDSGPQIRNLLYDRFKLPVVHKTKPSKTHPTGQASVDADTLEGLADPNCGNTPQEAREFINHLLKSKKYNKSQDSLISYKNWSLFNYLHSIINITGTSFTRFSTNQPNIQNVGTGDSVGDEDKDFMLRSVFGPQPGFEWLSIDYQSIEALIWAYSAKNREIMKCVAENVSPFKPLMEAIHGFFDKSNPWYKPVKNGFYSILYGARKSHSDATFGKQGAVDAIIKRVPEVRSFTNKLHREVLKCGYIITKGGYRLYVPKNEPHKSTSAFVQGTAGETLARAMIYCHEYLQDFPRIKIIINIHDELVFEGPIGFCNQHEEKLCQLMTKAGEKYGVPSPVNSQRILNNWAEG